MGHAGQADRAGSRGVPRTVQECATRPSRDARSAGGEGGDPDGPVVVGVGDRGVAESALAWAVFQAQRHRRPVHLVHAVPHADDVSRAERLRLESVAAYRLSVAAGLADELCQGALPVTVEIAEGSAACVLLDHSEQASTVVVERPRLVVLDQAPAPSVTRGLAAESAAPVVMVPAGWTASEGDGLVVAAVGDPTHAGPVLSAAYRASDAFGARVEVVHTWWHADAEPGVREAVSGSSGGAVRLVEGRGGDALVARSFAADLLVVARPAERITHGAVPAAVETALYEAVCPVLVVAPGQSSGLLRPRRSLSVVR